MPEKAKEQEHQTTRTVRANGQQQIDCSCGAMWVHGKDETPEQLESIYQSHLGYFNRPKLETL